MSSFLKMIERPEVRNHNGRGPLSFHRAHIDGMPYRGQAVMLRDEEYDEYTETVKDSGVETFDMSDPKQKEELRQIVELQQNGNCAILRFNEQMVPQPDGSMKVFVFCVWSTSVKELAKHRLPPGLLNQ